MTLADLAVNCALMSHTHRDLVLKKHKTIHNQMKMRLHNSLIFLIRYWLYVFNDLVSDEIKTKWRHNVLEVEHQVAGKGQIRTRAPVGHSMRLCVLRKV